MDEDGTPQPDPTVQPDPTSQPPGAEDARALERRVVLVWRLALLPALLPPAVGIGLLLQVLPVLPLLPVSAWAVALPAAVVAAVVIGPVQTLRWRRWSWRLTDAAIELRSGVLTRRHVVVPHFRVQQIDVLEGPIERLLGLATLRVTTASASGSVELPGLAAGLAPGLRSELLARAARANVELGRSGRDAV
jgi:membrane protein YdbS with pleckstrin-like domain